MLYYFTSDHRDGIFVLSQEREISPLPLEPISFCRDFPGAIAMVTLKLEPVIHLSAEQFTQLRIELN